MGRGKIELLDTLLDQKLIGRLLWEHGNKLFRGVKQFFWFGRLINIMVFPAESFILIRCGLTTVTKNPALERELAMDSWYLPVHSITILVSPSSEAR